jgi:hypothetical protein
MSDVVEYKIKLQKDWGLLPLWRIFNSALCYRLFNFSVGIAQLLVFVTHNIPLVGNQC